MKWNLDEKINPSSYTAEPSSSAAGTVSCNHKIPPNPSNPDHTEEYFETLLKELPDGVLITDPHGKILRGNESFYAMFGYCEEDISGRYLHEIMPDSHIQQEIRSNFRKLAKAKLDKVEAIRQNKDGSFLEVIIHGGPILHEGKVTAVFIIYMNISGRKKIERSLKESQKRFSIAIEATNEGLWDWNLLTDEVYFSPRYYTMLGYEPGEFPPLLESWLKLLHPEDREKALTLNNFYKKNALETFEIEFRLRKKDDSWIWILGKGRVVNRDEEGTPLRMIGTHADISERKKAENIIKEKEEFSSSLLEHAPHPIVVYEPDLSIKYVNPAFIELTNFTKEELTGLKPPFPWWPDNHSQHLTLLKNSMGGSRKHEMIFYTKDRVPFWVELSPKAIRIQGDITYYLSNWVDITERKQTSQDLEKEKRYWQQLFENAPEGIVLFNEEDRVLRANKTFSDIFSYEEKEVLGQIIDDLVASPEGYYSKAREYSRSAREGEKISLDTIRFRKDGTPINVSVLGVPLKMGDGTSFGYGIYRDITARKKIEEALDIEHNYLLNLFEGAPEGIVLCDKDQIVMRVNRAFCKLFGYT